MPRVSERPTTPPSFDLAQYAKQSESRQRSAEADPEPRETRETGETADETPHSETRIVTRPTIWVALTDEAWARAMIGAPVISMSPERLLRLPLDHRAGFLLSLMDGTMDLATVVEVSAMPRNDALRVVRDLFESGVVAFR
jgi:hypothetical protein